MSEASASPAATNNGTKSGKNHNGTIASRSTSTKNSSFDATQTTGPDAFSNAASIQSSSGQSPDSSSSSSPGSSSSSNSGSISQGGSTSTIKEKLENNNGIAAALARSLTRGVAIYFSRPVRLFRPSKGMHIFCFLRFNRLS